MEEVNYDVQKEERKVTKQLARISIQARKAIEEACLNTELRLVVACVGGNSAGKGKRGWRRGAWE